MTEPVKIQADLDHPDRVLAGMTARQVMILAGTALIIYSGWLLARGSVPVLVYLLGAVPVAVTGIALAIFRRDGVSLDRLALAGLLYRARPRRLIGPPPRSGVPVPVWLAERADPLPPHHMPHNADLAGNEDSWGEDPRLRRGRVGRLALPVRALDEFVIGGAGFLDLGGDGLAVLAAATPVPFGMRPPAEQQAMVDCFARLLLAADGPLQILVRALPVDLFPALAELAQAATTLPHPALRNAAAGHHDYLAALATGQQLLTHRVVLVLREAAPTRSGARAGAARERLLARLSDAARALAPAGVTLTPLSPEDAETVLADATNSDPAQPTP